VGSAYLFEKLRGIQHADTGGWKLQHATIDDGRRELKLWHTASNDDGQEAELCPAAEELKSGDSSYTPNTS
jgi:hypothetical protein